jgi:oxygen-independent coproporphyrinogen-3 oxidase
LQNEIVRTVYFGGGTPSVLNERNLGEILNQINTNFEIDNNTELTFEANPDDLDSGYLKMLKRNGINPLSIGIQSFQDAHLKKLNRRHNSKQAIHSVQNAAKTGFKNISVDLIYGLPGLTAEEWKKDIQKCVELPVVHVSAYHLTYHPGTTFYTWLKKGTLKELKETESVKQTNILLEMLDKAEFEQYEISNFAKNQLYSRHNASYWNGTTYLGLGPSAHSYDGKSRRWNVAHLDSYLKGVQNGNKFWEEEMLTETDKFNELILTQIRTKWGISLIEIKNQFGNEKSDNFISNIEKFVNTGMIKIENNFVKLTRKGLFVSDNIISDLIII